MAKPATHVIKRFPEHELAIERSGQKERELPFHVR